MDDKFIKHNSKKIKNHLDSSIKTLFKEVQLFLALFVKNLTPFRKLLQ